MTDNQRPTLPLPVAVLGFSYLDDPRNRTHAILEFQTPANPIRLFLTKQQIDELADSSASAASKFGQ